MEKVTKITLLISGIICLVIMPSIFGFMNNHLAMVESIGAGGILLLIANIDKLKHFKAGNIEAELREEIREAYVTINNLRELGIGVVKPLMVLLTMQNRQEEYIAFSFKWDLMEYLLESLRKLDTDQAVIEKTRSYFDATVIEDYIKYLIFELLRLDDESFENLEEFTNLKEIADINNITMEEICSAISTNHLNNPYIVELLKDIEYFKKNKQIRRIEVFDKKVFGPYKAKK